MVVRRAIVGLSGLRSGPRCTADSGHSYGPMATAGRDGQTSTIELSAKLSGKSKLPLYIATSYNHTQCICVYNTIDGYLLTLLQYNCCRYLKQGDENESQEESQDLYNFWHQKLADYFETSSNLERKAEVGIIEMFLHKYRNVRPIRRGFLL